jgi:hypothetical protein
VGSGTPDSQEHNLLVMEQETMFDGQDLWVQEHRQEHDQLVMEQHTMFDGQELWVQEH